MPIPNFILFVLTASAKVSNVQLLQQYITNGVSRDVHHRGKKTSALTLGVKDRKWAVVAYVRMHSIETREDA